MSMQAKQFRFQQGQRVRIVAADHPMHGETGVVCRIMMRGGGARGAPSEAWVHMDRPLPPDLRSFPAGDHRADMAPFYDFECESAAASDAPMFCRHEIAWPGCLSCHSPPFRTIPGEERVRNNGSTALARTYPRGETDARASTGGGA